MPTLKFPLVGSYNNRSFAAVSGKDQTVKGAIITRVDNKQSRTATYYTEKRTGQVTQSTPSAGQIGKGVYHSPSISNSIFSAFVDSGLSNYEIFSDTTSCGLIPLSGVDLIFSETTLSSITYILITAVSDTAGTGWYLASDSYSNTAYTADGNNSTTITDIKVAGVPSVSGLYVGQKLTAATNIVAGSRIVSINAGAFSAVLDTATTGGAFNDLAITKEPIAKIIDAEFPTDIVGGFVELNGYIAIMTLTGKAYNSDLNTVSAWSASNYLTCDKTSDQGRGLCKYRDHIAAFGNASIEFLYNAGNPSGSPFSSSQSAVTSRSGSLVSGLQVIAAHNNIYWIGSDNNVYTLEGFSQKLLSSAPWILQASSVTICAFSYNKKPYLGLWRNATFWYSINDDTWVDAGFGAETTFMTYMPTAGTSYIVRGDASGKVFYLRDNNNPASSFQDNGGTLTTSIQIATDMGTNERKFADEIRILADVQSSGVLSVSWSDDDGANYSTARDIALTAQGTMRLTRLGSWKGKRLWKFEHTANAPFRAWLCEIDWEPAQ